jgi:RNA polymerase sigma factor (sigma-70 family)
MGDTTAVPAGLFISTSAVTPASPSSGKSTKKVRRIRYVRPSVIVEGSRMPTRPMNRFLDRLRHAALVHDGAGLTDGQLLTCFVRHRDADAFTALVRRHGPMVLGICRRILRNTHDAEDAFQATFLVFARKAGSVAIPNALGGWLCRVAYRTALEARTRIARRHAKEQQVKEMPDRETELEEEWYELLPLLDRELDRLPEKYRLPMVLCELEGRSRKQVALQLHIPEGTVSSRLAYARKLLAKRLSRYGAGAVVAVLSGNALSASVHPSLLNATSQAAMQVVAGRALTTAVVSAQVVTLTEGVLKAMLWSKIKVGWVVVLAVSVSAGAAGLTYRASASPPQQAASAGARVADELEELRLQVAALQKGLQVTRDQVKSLKAEVAVLKWATSGSTSTSSTSEGASSGSSTGLNTGTSSGSSSSSDAARLGAFTNLYQKGYITRTEVIGKLENARNLTAPTDDALVRAEAALKRLRQHPDDKEAADALEQAVRRLKEQSKSKLETNKRRQN